MAVSVSPAASPDRHDLADLAARTFPLACPPDVDPADIADFITAHLSADAFAGYLDTDGHRVLIARDHAGVAVAYALLVDGTAMDPRCAGLLSGSPTVGVSKFYLDPARHGDGTAGALWEAVVDAVRGAGARTVWLATNEHNARARRFYERLGFRACGGRDFRVGDRVHRDVVYEVDLGERDPGAG